MAFDTTHDPEFYGKAPAYVNGAGAATSWAHRIDPARAERESLMDDCYAADESLGSHAERIEAEAEMEQMEEASR